MELTNLSTAEKLGLSVDEYAQIIKNLGRVPNFTELSIYSVMWSEHCSYKNSIIWLKTLPKDSDRMLIKAGEENAGLVDIGDSLGCSFKIESHNHPSAIEPYQGAAMGVGGINRDIFLWGRPIAQLNSLRFGGIKLDKTKWLVKGVVKGIVAKFLLVHQNIASRQWIYEQYDSMLGTANTSTNAPSDAAIVVVKGTNKNLVMTVDCNARYVQAEPENGCAIALAEAARNIVCSGGEPIAITNCLNFGNPHVPEVYWQFVGTIKGMTKACLKFETPVTGGNVSFYNQSASGDSVFPTPTIGMLGLLEGLENRMTLNFKNQDDLIYLVGEAQNCISSSEYLYSFHKVKASPAPHFDLDTEHSKQLQN